MNILKRLLFIIAFMPLCTINAIYDTIMFVYKGDKHKCFGILNWVNNKLIVSK